MKHPIFYTALMVITALASSMTLTGQTVYSNFLSPSPGIDYAYSTTGMCMGCAITNSSNAASLSLTDSTHVYMTVGVLNGISTRLKLTDTARMDMGILLAATPAC